ncbi:MAG: VCBS repeat-containing protein [Planctomycetota bacterium]
MSRTWLGGIGFLLITAGSVAGRTGYDVLRPVPEWYPEHQITYLRAGPDLDGDGYDDYLVHYGGWYGNDSPPVVVLSSGIDGHVLATHKPEENLNSGGESDFGDLNGDGLTDLVLGWSAVLNPDRTGTGRVIATTIDGSHVYWSRYAEDGVAFFGDKLRVAPDLDGDGCDDVLVYATSFSGHPNVGQVDVLSGRDGTTLYHYKGSYRGEVYGEQVHHGLGDFDGDGFNDFVISSSYFRYVAWIHSGRTGEVIRVIKGADFFGYYVSTPGDIDGDGFSDVILGSSSAVFAFSISQTDPLWTWRDPEETSIGGVSQLADVNSDGADDILVALPLKRSWRHANGVVHILSGRTGQELVVTKRTQQEEGYFGSGVTGLGDVDGDGQADWAARSYIAPWETSLLVYTRRTLQFNPHHSFVPWNLHVHVPSCAGKAFLLLFALSAGEGVPLGGRRIPLDVDRLFVWSLEHPQGGVLDGGGEAFVMIPDLVFGGCTTGEVSCAGLVLDPAAPLGVKTITTRARLAPW